MKEQYPVNTMVCILGMHRSGTSCLAGCLEEQGLHLGDVNSYAPYNLKGNKEHLSLRSINDDVLSQSDGAWDRPPAQLIWNDALRHRRDEYISDHSAYKTWGFKDPRTLITLPFWLEAKLDIMYVGSFRHPHAVSQSLMRRKGVLPSTPPLRLWKYYNLKLLEYAAEFHFPLMCFDNPMEIYYRELNEVVKYLGLLKKPESSSRFFDNDLRNSDLAGVESKFPDVESRAIYEQLLSHSIGRDQV